jgi:hypothetical protein
MTCRSISGAVDTLGQYSKRLRSLIRRLRLAAVQSPSIDMSNFFHFETLPRSGQCQIECQIRGIGGISGDRRAILISKLVIPLGLAAGSSPSLTTSQINRIELHSWMAIPIVSAG